MKNIKEKGITLIALVITIIILLILAGVTIKIVLDNNLIGKTQTAVNIYNEQQAKEKLRLALLTYQILEYSGDNEKTLEDTIKEIGGEIEHNEEQGIYKIKLDGYEFEINDEELTLKEENTKPVEPEKPINNIDPVLGEVRVEDRGTDFIKIRANATDDDNDNLIYKLYLKTEDGTYPSTPNATSSAAQGTNVDLNVTEGLTEYTIYDYKVVVTDEKTTKTISKEGTTGTGCSGQGETKNCFDLEEMYSYEDCSMTWGNCIYSGDPYWRVVRNHVRYLPKLRE